MLEPRRPESKGQLERTIRHLETSFLPLRSFAGIEDLQDQSDRWNVDVAGRRHHRRVGATVDGALRAEQGFLRGLPAALPDTDRHLEARVSRDGFVRVGGADYSLPPGFAGRRVQVRLSPQRVEVCYDGHRVAAHRRSYVPAGVVLDPAHARALRLAREARRRLDRNAVEVPAPDLARYDRLAGVAP